MNPFMGYVGVISVPKFRVYTRNQDAELLISSVLQPRLGKKDA